MRQRSTLEEALAVLNTSVAEKQCSGKYDGEKDEQNSSAKNFQRPLRTLGLQTPKL